jgi:hypothetical protein
MNEEITKKLLEYIDKTGDFLLEQAPEVLQQALKYHYYSSLIYSVFFIIGFLFSISIGYYFYFYPNLDEYGNRDLASILLPPYSLIGIFATLASLCYEIDKLMKITLAPKYFLINLLR